MFLIVWSCCVVGLTTANHGSPSPVITEDITVEEDHPVFVSCHSTGDSTADIYWSKPNGQRIEDDQKNNVYASQENDQVLLTIVKAGPADEGEYVCQEISDTRETIVLSIASLRVLAKSEPRFEKPYVIVHVLEGENVRLTCEAAGDLPMDFTWVDKNSAVIVDRFVWQSGNRSELNLPAVSDEKSGIYTCIARNSLGTESKLFELIVHKREDIFPPFFNESNEDVYGKEFEQLTLMCSAESKPPSSYKWFDKYGKELNKNHPRVIETGHLIFNSSGTSEHPNSSIVIDVSGKNALLTFVSFVKSDSGNYTCKAENQLGEAYKTFNVSVKNSTDEYPPTFKETRVEVHGVEDESLTLNCQAEGNPSPTYFWYNLYGEKLDRFHQRVVDLEIWNHSLEIPHKRPSTILVVPSNGTLIFVQLKRNDAGHYTCYAQNSGGRASKTYRIYVTETGDDLTAQVLNVTHDSVTFELIPRVSGIEGFEVKYTLQPAFSRYKTNTTVIVWMVGEEYKVTGLLSGSKYSFEFRILPTGNWTDPITVSLPPGPPEIIVRQVTPNKLNMEFFRPFYTYGYNSIERYIIKYRTVQQVGGNSWKYSDCAVTIDLPFCYAGSYEISNLASRFYYSITVQAVGPGGYSEPSEMKIFIP